MANKPVLHLWEGIHWEINYNDFDQEYVIPRCPKAKCNCKLIKSNEQYSRGEYKYKCIKCDFRITLDKDIEKKGIDFLMILESKSFSEAEIINIDGELIKVQRVMDADDQYWVDVKLSKNKKGDMQLMVLAGSKMQHDKTQLFLDPKNERLTFDQFNDHPRKIFTKVTATFKNTEVKITQTENK
jgi:hypothetical protein